MLFAVLLCSQTQKRADAFVYLQEIALQIKSIEIEDEIKVNDEIILLTRFIDNVSANLKAISVVEPDAKNTFVNIVNNIINYYDEKLFHDFFSQYQNGDYFNTIKCQFIDLLWDEYLCRNDWVTSLSAFEGEMSIPVMTIHKSKGLEYECVFIIGLEDNSFFSFNRQRDEDICALFVGISRAKSELHITRSEYHTSLSRNTGLQSVTAIQMLHDAITASKVVSLVDHRIHSQK